VAYTRMRVDKWRVQINIIVLRLGKSYGAVVRALASSNVAWVPGSSLGVETMCGFERFRRFLGFLSLQRQTFKIPIPFLRIWHNKFQFISWLNVFSSSSFVLFQNLILFQTVWIFIFLWGRVEFKPLSRSLQATLIVAIIPCGGHLAKYLVQAPVIL